MPKKQTTASKKARAAAREGDKFTKSLRAFEGAITVKMDHSMRHALAVLGRGTDSPPDELIKQAFLRLAWQVEIGRRVVWAEDLGDRISDDDLLSETLFDRGGRAGSPGAVLAEGERWHERRVERDWMEHASEQLARHDITWEVGSDRVMVPQGMTDPEASQLWEEVRTGFEAWIDGVIEETRRGKPGPNERGIRAEEATGGLWVAPAFTS